MTILNFGKRRSISIRRKLVFSFTAILLVPTLIIGGISYQTAKQKVEDQMVGEAETSVHFMNAMVEEFFDAKSREMEFISQGIAEQAYANGFEAIQGHLDRYMLIQDDVSVVFLGTDRKDFVTSPAVEVGDDYDPTARPWYAEAMASPNEVIVTKPYASSDGSGIVVTVAKATADKKGVLGFDISIAELVDLAKGTKIGRKGYLGILDREGNVIVHPTASPGESLLIDATRPMYESDAGSYNYDYEGAEKFMVYETNGATGWKLMGTMFTREFGQESAGIFNTTVAVIVGSLLIGGIGVYLIIRSVLRPIRNLVVVAAKVGEGDLTEMVKVNSADEIGRLGNIFNDMIRYLHTMIIEVGQTSTQIAASSEELTASSEQTAKASEEIAHSIQEMAIGGERQVRSVERGVQSVAAMTSGIKDIARHAEEASANASVAVIKSQDGERAIDATLSQMRSIEEAVGSLEKVIASLIDRAKEIGNITEVISQIAGQTNLLALNASIEAARAGEYGKGFSVVAGEIKKLAEQSTSSAERISRLISEIQRETSATQRLMGATSVEVRSGTDVMQELGALFRDVFVSVDSVARQINEVSTLSGNVSEETGGVVSVIEEVSSIAEESSAGTHNVSASSQEQLASMEEISASAGALAKMAEDLQLLVERFKV